MERPKNIINNYIPHSFLIIMFTVGIIGHLLPLLYPLMITLTPYTLLLTGSVVLFGYRKELSKNLIIWFISVFLITFLLEVAGVKTGMVFGNYSYTHVLGFSIFSVPLIIGFNWSVIILGSVIIAAKLTKNAFLASLVAALIALLFDFLLEPVAIKLSYWIWDANVVPVQNYIAWFTIAFLSSLAFFLTNKHLEEKLAAFYLLVQFIFFLALNLFI